MFRIILLMINGIVYSAQQTTSEQPRSILDDIPFVVSRPATPTESPEIKSIKQ